MDCGFKLVGQYQRIVQTMSDQYVIVEAIFNAERKGHFGMFSGSLEEIKRLERWPAQAEIEKYLRLQPQ